MTTENDGLYTNIETDKAGAAGADGTDGANNPNQSMDTLPLGEGVHTVEEAEHHEEGARWNDGNVPHHENKNESANDNREQER